MEIKEIILNPSLIPARTESYQPISHGDVIAMTLAALDKNGLSVLSEHYSSAQDGLQAAGSYSIAGGDDEMLIRLMWQNSYNKTRTLKWCIGAHVFICGNGCVSGDMGAFKRRHTGSYN